MRQHLLAVLPRLSFFFLACAIFIYFTAMSVSSPTVWPQPPLIPSYFGKDTIHFGDLDNEILRNIVSLTMDRSQATYSPRSFTSSLFFQPFAGLLIVFFCLVFLFHIEITIEFFQCLFFLPVWISLTCTPVISRPPMPAVRRPAASRSAPAEGHADSWDSRHAAGASLHCRGVAARSRYVTPLLHTRGDSCTIPVCPWDTQQPVNRVQSWLWVPAAPSDLSFLWLTVDVENKEFMARKKAAFVKHGDSKRHKSYKFMVQFSSVPAESPYKRVCTLKNKTWIVLSGLRHFHLFIYFSSKIAFSMAVSLSICKEALVHAQFWSIYASNIFHSITMQCLPQSESFCWSGTLILIPPNLINRPALPRCCFHFTFLRLQFSPKAFRMLGGGL